MLNKEMNVVSTLQKPGVFLGLFFSIQVELKDGAVATGPQLTLHSHQKVLEHLGQGQKIQSQGKKRREG